MHNKEKMFVLKGFAVILMLYHHLFAFPERINYSYYLIGFEFYFAIFGKVCVGIFLFLSGFGLEKSNISTYNEIVIRIKKFYKKLWSIFFIFIPLGVILKKINIGSVINVLLNIFMIEITYNTSWWFANTYILLLLLYPLIIQLINKHIKISVIIHIMAYILYVIMILIKKYFKVDIPKQIMDLLLWQFIFYLGIIESKFRLSKKININTSYPLFKIIFLFIFRTFLYKLSNYIKLKLNITIDIIIFDPLIVYFFINYLYILLDRKNLNLLRYRLLIEIGKYSSYIWLIHEFFNRYFFQKYIYMPKYSIIIFCNLLLLSILTSKLIKNIEYTFNKTKIFYRKREKE